MAGQGLLHPLAELGLLEAPVLHVEGVGFVHRVEAAHGLGGQQGAGPGLGDVGRHGSIRRRAADADQSEAGHGHQPGQGIERFLAATHPRALALEIGLVVCDVTSKSLLDRRRERIGRQHQRKRLGADHMVGGGDPAAGPVGQARIVDDRAGERGVAQGEQPAERSSFRLRRSGQGSPQHWQQGGRPTGRRGHGRRQARRRDRRGLSKSLLGLAHQRDHPLVALLGGSTEGEQAVLQQHHALELHPRGPRPLLGLLIGRRRRQGQIEAGHHVGHQRHPLAVDLAADLGGIRLVRQGQQSHRMGVVHEGVGQEGVQQGLHRGIWRRRIDQVAALGGHHFLIAEGRQGSQGLQLLQPHRRVARRLDRGQIPARALHAQHRDRLAQQAGDGGFHRRVAAAMEHQVGVGAQQAGGIGAQSQILTHPLGAVAGDRFGGLSVRPAVEDRHRALEQAAREIKGREGSLQPPHEERRIPPFLIPC
jgi:hypothetical protein